MRLENSQEHRGRPVTNGSSQNGSSPRANGETNGYGHNDSPSTVALHHDNTPFRGHDREEVTKVLLQALSDLGYRGAAQQVSRESGYQLELPTVAAFRNAVQSGEWDEAEAVLFGSDVAELDGGVPLGNGHTTTTPHKSRGSIGSTNGNARHGLSLAEGADTVALRFVLRQQKYLELLEGRDLGAALHVLRNELTPLKRDTGRLHALSALMMCSSPEDLYARANWDGAEGESRNQLLSEVSKSISPSVMIPEHRLAALLTTLQRERIEGCRYHNTTAQPSLYTDHMCSPDDFPLQTLTELKHHSDEVWFLEFSHDGSLLATAGRDGLVTIHDTNRWKVLHEFREHGRNANAPGDRGVTCVAFSPDDRYLVTCSWAREFVVMDMHEGRLAAIADHFDYPVSAAAWLPDSQTIVIGTQSSSRPLGMYSMSAASASSSGVIRNNEIHSWRDPPLGGNIKENAPLFRIADVAVSGDGTRMAAATIEKESSRILLYDLKTREKISEWRMDDKVSSVNYSQDRSLLLITMNEGKVWALDSVTGETVMQYEGARQEKYVLRSCFGGANENFVVCGSEDSLVHIWRRQTGVEVVALAAHAPNTVNAVAWHPRNPAIFASAGDDRKVRIWASANALQAYSAETGPGTSRANAGLYPFAR